MVIPQDRRRHPRAKAKWSVTIETTQGVINTEIQDISVVGAFVRCLHPFRPDEVFKMVINVPHAHRRLQLDSEVVWVNVQGPDHSPTPRGMGVQFIQISGSDQRFLTRMVLDRL